LRRLNATLLSFTYVQGEPQFCMFSWCPLRPHPGSHVGCSWQVFASGCALYASYWCQSPVESVDSMVLSAGGYLLRMSAYWCQVWPYSVPVNVAHLVPACSDDLQFFVPHVWSLLPLVALPLRTAAGITFRLSHWRPGLMCTG
jgi:hypothetical protein